MDVVSECRPAVQALVARILRRPKDHPDVEDCTHEALRRALENPSALKKDHPVRPWLLGIARHVALDALRVQYRGRARTALPFASQAGGADSQSGADIDILERLPDPSSGPEVLAARRQQAERLRVALQELPTQQRDALLLFHRDELGYREIAEKLGVPVGTVGTWVLRARQAVATAVGRESMVGEAATGAERGRS